MKRLFLVSGVALMSVGLPYAAHAAGSFYFPALTQSHSYVEVSNQASASQAAETFITKLTNEGIGFLSNEQITADQQRNEFRKLLNNNFDLNTIARFSLGRHWRSATEAQRQEYLKLFKKMIVDVYSARFNDYEGQVISVTGSREEGKKDILVHSQLEQDSGPAVRVDWRVRNRNGQYKVIDVIVEGVSMALTQRSDFSSVVQRGGGDMEALLAHLRQN